VPQSLAAAFYLHWGMRHYEIMYWITCQKIAVFTVPPNRRNPKVFFWLKEFHQSHLPSVVPSSAVGWISKYLNNWISIANNAYLEMLREVTCHFASSETEPIKGHLWLNSPGGSYSLWHCMQRRDGLCHSDSEWSTFEKRSCPRIIAETERTRAKQPVRRQPPPHFDCL
jgi:hypothetical protein